MASVTATINVQINAANAAAQLTALQGKVAAMNKGMLAATAGGVMAQEKAIRRMGNVLSGSGMFTTGIRNVHTELGRMHQEFDKGSTTLQKYRQNSRMWGKDHSAINRMAADRVRMLQTQYVALGKEMGGVQKAMAIKPDRMMREFGADVEYAHQKSMLFRRNLQMGSTALVNWGKNTQWAGRQMMVGMGIPIAIAAAGAIKSFNDIEKSSIAFKRVYGDTATSVAEKSEMLAKVQNTVGKEMMKYGVSMADTLDMSARAAATGAKGADLIAASRETLRLATLGDMDYNKALEATIAMQTAFGISSKNMASTTDFLNAVENQTILTMEDMAVAVPRVAPVVKGLGGDVKDLAVMMTALRQGGVSAEQGANALKSGLASMISPTSTATKELGDMGINIEKITKRNRGDLIGTIQDLGKAMDGLNKYQRQQALESLFGKYQYSRMGALLKNINSKAAKETMAMAKAGRQELARMSQQELDQISASPMIKLRASIEELKAAAAPLGALFSEIAASLVGFATPVVKFFANNDIAKWGLVATAGFAALAGTLTMIVGVLANFTGMMIKAGMAVRTAFRFMTGQRSLAYVATDELAASAAANSLATAAQRAAGGMMAEAKAAQLLTSQLEALIAAQTGAAATSRRGPGPGGTTGVPVAPKPGGPGGTPLPVTTTRQNIISEAGYAALLADSPQRAHIGGGRVLTQKEILALDTPGSRNKKAAELIAKAKAGEISLLGKTDRTLMQGQRINTGTAAGMPARQWAALMSAQPTAFTTSSLMDTVGGNLGLSTQQERAAWAASPEGQKLQRLVVDSSIAHMNSLGDALVQDTGQKGMRSIEQEIGRATESAIQNSDLPANVKEAYAKTGQVGWVRDAASDGKYSRIGGTKSSVSYEGTTKTGGQGVREMISAYDSSRELPAGKEVTPSGLVVPKGTMAQQRQTAESVAKYNEQAMKSGKQIIPPVMPTDKLPQSPVGGKPVPKTGFTARYQSALAARQQRGGMAGMGLMGVGMLASTAMMGLEMAGKEVPNAAQFAVQGLTGVGMASMFFPGTMMKLSAGMSAALAGMGPFAIAAGAAAAAIGGTAILWNKINEDARNEGVALATAMNDATTSAEDVGTAFGNTSYVTKQALKDSGTTSEGLNTAQQFLQSEVGKQFLRDYSSVAAQTSGAIAASSMGSKIASWVVQGVMTGNDVKGLIVALNAQSPGMGNVIGAQAAQLLGPGYNARNPAQVGRNVFAQQSATTQQAMDILRSKSEELSGPTIGDWARSIGKQVFLPTALMGTFNAVKGLLGGGGIKESLSNIPVVGQFMKAGDDRAASERLNASTATVWSSQLKTAFQNRMAVEVQLKQMIDERNRLKRRETKGTATDDEVKQLRRLQEILPKVRASRKEYDKEIASGFKQTMASVPGADNEQAQQQWYDAQRRVGRKSGKTDAMLGMGVDQIDAQLQNKMISLTTANSAMAALNTGIMSPATFQIISENGRAIASVGNVLGALPADKVAQLNTELSNMTGAQATNAVTKYGKSFKNLTSQLKLTPQQKSDLATALGIKPPEEPGPVRGKGPNKPPKDLVQKIKQRAVKDKDIDKKPKDQEYKVKAKAETENAEKKVKGLGATVDATSKKKINIKATANVGGAEKKIKGLGAAAGAGTDVSINQTVNRVLGDDQSKTPPAPLIQLINRIIAADMSLIQPIPMNQIINRILGSTSLPPIPDAIQYVKRVPKNAMGGEVVTGFFASGGIHNGPGKVTGPGGPTEDKVNARLSDGEFVIKASSVKKYGTSFMSAVNQGRVEPLPGFAKGGSPIAAKGMDKDQKKDYESLVREAKATVKKVNALDKIAAALKKVVGGNKSIIYEIARRMIDENDPKQIKKMFAGKKDKGAKAIAKQFKAEQRAAMRDEFAAQQKQADLQKGLSNKIIRATANRNARNADIFAGMSTDQFEQYKRMPGKNKKRYRGNIALQQRAERAAEAAASLKGYGKGSESGMIAKVSNRSGIPLDKLSQYADALGMSMEDLSNQIDANMLPQNLAQLGEAALNAQKALEVINMKGFEKEQQKKSNFGSMQSVYEEAAAAQGRINVRNKFGGKHQSQVEAEIGKREAEISIEQAKLDDINYAYEKQTESLDQIAQIQQEIANLEQGRLGVANALSQGDIAAAAAQAQQQRAATAQFMQGQMRTQLENQQKAQTLALEERIRVLSNQNRDDQNQIAMAIADANVEYAARIGHYQNEQDIIAVNKDTQDAIVADLVAQNALLSQGLSLLQDQVQAALTLQAVISGGTDAPKGTKIPVVSGGGKGFKVKKKRKKKKAFGGFIPGIGNSDSEHIMATPGEFVVRKAAAAKFGPTLHAMNSGSLKPGELGGSGTSIGSVVFNINGGNLNERQVADIAVRKMHDLGSGTLRGGRF